MGVLLNQSGTSILFNGIGGGGGGTSNYNQLSNKPQINGVTLQDNKTDSDLHLLGSYTEMPVASAELANKIVHFAGEGGKEGYVTGYFYKCVSQGTQEELKIAQTSGSSLKGVDIDKDTFLAKEQPKSDETIDFIYNFAASSWTRDGSNVVISEYGITFDGMPGDGDILEVVYRIGSSTYEWVQTDTQPKLWEKGTGEGSIVSIPNALQGGQAVGHYSVAEGYGSDAKGNYSHAEGQLTTTNGSCAHAEGSGTTAQADCSHAEGLDTIAQNQSEHAEGQFNKSNKASSNFGDAGNTIHSIGIGTGIGSLEDQDRRNAVEVMQNGDIYINGVGGYDGDNYSEADTLQEVVNGKQDSLTIGTGLTLDDTTNTLSANINNTVTSTSTTDSLSANMGKTLQDQITNLKNIGRFLSIFNCATGKPETDPEVMPYEYRTGDYYRVGTVAGDGGTNYKPNGTTYTGQPSTTVETEEVDIGYVYYFDGIEWKMQSAGSGGKVQDVQINGTTILDLDSGIANIPKASPSNLGVVKENDTYHIHIDTYGNITPIKATDNEIAAKVNEWAFIVARNLDKAVMEGLGNNSLTWSALYKSSACSTIGAQQEINLHIDSTL